MLMTFLANVRVDVDEIQYSAMTCWFAESHAGVFMTQETFNGENFADVI